MEPLKRALKIGTGLAALVVGCLMILPERPTLLAGAMSEADQGSAPAVETLLADSSPRSSASDATADAPLVVAQNEAGPPTDGQAAPTAGQMHLQRLRERNTSTAPAPAAPSPAPAPTAPAPAATPDAAPRAGTPTPPAEPAPGEAAVGGGQGLDSLTRPSAPPQFRLFRSAEAVDSATIRAGGETIRLAGLLPVAANARCADGNACGAEAREALDAWLADREVLCAIEPGNASQTPSAPCVRGEDDIGEWAVENGWAVAEPGSVYAAAEAEARAAGRGIWGSGGL